MGPVVPQETTSQWPEVALQVVPNVMHGLFTPQRWVQTFAGQPQGLSSQIGPTLLEAQSVSLVQSPPIMQAPPQFSCEIGEH